MKVFCMDRVSLDLLRVARLVLGFRKSKERPSTLFEGRFYDLRSWVKVMRMKAEREVIGDLELVVLKYLKDSGYEYESEGLKLGRYRGSGFPTSFKIRVRVKGDLDAKELVFKLRGKFSPKWRIKGLEHGVVELNIR